MLNITLSGSKAFKSLLIPSIDLLKITRLQRLHNGGPSMWDMIGKEFIELAFKRRNIDSLSE